ncbi:Putative O-methyltransferase domain, S-adenosyl-L-methionine-dependent methyltransferase [Septoria linicola]|uniref:O-methyltransferase domain, S-adenosyl-L-methionine-dependent methyltransferase n=1 Tax=Septoria linicola TaxID=215465 RepID=A0A9Q9AW33_9PEZI|nr:Putative O-methyltransferase domain, S-adenosyl-L-methionine-dependent methyltransferase [Septoria linicola]
MAPSKTLRDLEGLAASIEHDGFQHEHERRQAVQLAHKLIPKIESPWETASRLLLIDPFAVAALKTLSNLGLFTKWQPVDSPKTLHELAQLTQCESRLLYRLLLAMVPQHWLEYYADDQTFALTSFTKAIQDTSLAATMTFHSNVVSPAATKLPEFLAATQYTNPTDPLLSLWPYIAGSELVPWFQQNSESFISLHHVMRLRGNHSQKWTEFYPWKEQIVDRLTPGRVAFVDIGGGVGQDSEALRLKAPHSFPAGSIVLQDLAEVVNRAEAAGDSIVRMQHNFFEPQPESVHGAAIFFMHLVLHDWPDDKAKEILTNLKPAFKRGYSRLLINDIVLTASMDTMVSASDLHMTMNGAGERTEEEWQSLLEASGFRIINWYFSPLSEQAIIEAELT